MFVVPAPTADGPLAGRDRETGRLGDIVAALAAGRGAVLDIAGDPGIGKTRLAAELTERAARRGLPVLRACALRTDARPFQVFRDAGCADPRPGERDRYDTVVERAAGGVLVLEDLHGCDPASLELLLRLIRSPAPAPYVLALVHRPRQSPPALLAALDHGVRTGTVTRLAPEPLDTAGVSALLAAWRAPGAGGEEEHPAGDGRFVDRLTAASGGNPRQLRLLVAACWDPDQWPDRAGADSDGLLREATAVIAELDALSPRAAVAARTAAVLGEPFRLDDVARISGLGPERTLDAFAELVRADLMRTAGRGGLPAFRHPVIGHIAHESADLSFRLRAHRHALTMIAERGGPAREQARHAEHLAGADPAAAAVLAEGAAEIVTGTPATAARWLRLALDARPSRGPAAGPSLELACCRALIAAGRLEEARALAHELLAGLGPQDGLERLLKAHAVCAAAERLLCRYEEAEAIARTGRALLPAPLPPVLSAAATDLILEYGLVHVLRGTHDQVLPVLREASRARSEAPATVSTALRVLIAFCDVFSGSVAQAAPEVTRCARLVDALPDRIAGHTPDTLALLGCAELYLERFTDARRHLGRGLRAATGGAQKHIRAHQLLGLTMIDQWAGRLDEAQRSAREAELLARAVGAPDVVKLATAMRATTLVWARGRQHADRAVALAERAVDTVSLGRGWWATSAISLLAHAQLLGGDAAGCLRTLLDGGGGERLPQVQPTFRPSLLALMATAALAARGDTETARRLLARAETAAQGLGLPLQWACVRRAQAQLHGALGAPGTALDLFEGAAEQFRGAGLPLQQAWTLIAAAPAARAVHGPAAALALLERAESLARPSGAALVREQARRVRAELAERDAVPDSLRLLSGREREIAELAASGLRSRQIAERLFLSPRTVDSHLARVYRKLGVSSRLALAQVVRPSA
ncbi:LuxR C-terminal-related transcriptional regulator [Streptomyces sp. NPDC015171]|uniref:helix-turn-helix transcriptional regulator n=1 Tax=Streptomyces sp. NPDC015171 TaxID=3364945 RepID=UPI0036F7AA30